MGDACEDVCEALLTHEAERRLTPSLQFWLITLDYFFYVYHRACHESEFLWGIHRHHHTTRHPSPVLAILAESYQEVIEIALCPLAATLLVPMSFHELYMMVVSTLGVHWPTSTNDRFPPSVLLRLRRGMTSTATA